jgi:two-component system sensor histidine kinase ChvG
LQEGTESVEEVSTGQSPAAMKKASWSKLLRRRIARWFGRYIFTSLTRRIVVLNVAALTVLLTGIMFLHQFRDSLIEAREESLLTQGEIIAAAIAANATVDTDNLAIDPERLLELQAGESAFPMRSAEESFDFPVNPEQVAPILRRLISPTRTRARIYDLDGLIILDSDRLYLDGQIYRYNLPPVRETDETDWSERLEKSWLTFRNWFWQSDLPLYQEPADGSGTAFREVVTALTGAPGSTTRRNANGDTIVSVAVPIQRFRAVLGVLLLSTEAGAIDEVIENERWAIMRSFSVAVTVLLILSVLLASTIAKPLHRLSAAAERVRLGVGGREEIPDFSDRGDEIGHLSASLRAMTESLYARIEAIESFAADVAHELKNPLTSLRSAVETLPLAKNNEQREKLLSIIQHDVRRLDRLITDISDASRLDAELARENSGRVDIAELVTNVHATYANIAFHTNAEMPEVQLTVEEEPARKGAKQSSLLMVEGHAGRLGQVVTNLIENARSLVPTQGGKVRISLKRSGDEAVIAVTDNGPGIAPENTVRIFERFYTDRPDAEDFGQNSGLGLSIVQQIVEAHGGHIVAGNAADAQAEGSEDEGSEPLTGARFTVTLPLADEA